MAGRVKEDPKLRARLDARLGGAQSDHRRFTLVEIGHDQVEVHLLRHVLAGPLRRLVALHLLKGDAIAAVLRANFRPVPGALDRPTEQLPVELREDLWVGAVQNQAGKPRDSHTETLPVGFATRQEQDVGLF